MDAASLCKMKQDLKDQKAEMKANMEGIMEKMNLLRNEKEARAQVWEAQRQREIADATSKMEHAEREVNGAREMLERNQERQKLYAGANDELTDAKQQVETIVRETPADSVPSGGDSQSTEVDENEGYYSDDFEADVGDVNQ